MSSPSCLLARNRHTFHYSCRITTAITYDPTHLASRTALRYHFSARVTCMSLEVIRGGEVPPAACRMVCARSGTKSGPCVCLLLAYPATSLPIPATLSEVRSRMLPNLFLSMIKVHQLIPIAQTYFPSLPTFQLEFSSSCHLASRETGGASKVKNIGDTRTIPGLRTFKSPLFIRTPFVRKVTTRRRCLCC